VRDSAHRPTKNARSVIGALTNRDLAKLGGLGLVLLLLVCHELSLGVCLQDDAFISFRYAANLVTGHGLVFNIGERVEGYTNFLWTVLMALFMKLGLDILLTSRVAGILFSMGTAVLMYRFSRTVLRRESMLGLLGAAFFALNSAVATEAVQGLETQMFIFLAFAGQYLFLREESRQTGFPTSAILFGLASLTRPEGLLIFGVTMLFRAGVCLIRREKPATRDVKRLAVFGLIVLPYLVWRYAYYGFPFPNTFYAKVGWGLAQVERGAWYVGDFLFTVPFVFLSIPLLWLERRRTWIRYSLALALSYTAYVVCVGGDFKTTSRFMLPLLPVVYLWLQESVALASRLLKTKVSSWRAQVILAAVVVLLLCWTFFSTEAARSFAARRRRVLPRHTAAGQWLQRNVAADSVLASSAVGVIPYYSGLTTIDMWGLTDLHIAHMELPRMGSRPAGHEKGDGLYVLAREPDIILFHNSRFSQRPRTMEDIKPAGRSEREVWGEESFHTSYELRSVQLGSLYFNYFQRVVD
jgi:arabinofuranosyltransferase